VAPSGATVRGGAAARRRAAGREFHGRRNALRGPGRRGEGRGTGEAQDGPSAGQHGTAAWVRSVLHRILPRTNELIALAPSVCRPQLLEARAQAE
jgi:hypothetical protein